MVAMLLHLFKTVTVVEVSRVKADFFFQLVLSWVVLVCMTEKALCIMKRTL